MTDASAISPLWQADPVLRTVAGQLLEPQGALAQPDPSDGAIWGVSIDSRSVAAGDLFFAIRGERMDGHDFVAPALRQGAAFAVVARERAAALGADPDVDAARLIVVDDVLAAMEDLGRAARARFMGRVLAVTGSVGKTGTKEMLRLALGASGMVHASVASFNNHWGVPLTLSRTPADLAYAVYEIGMNHPGEIVPLVAQVRPHVAVITTVEPVHLAFFDSEQEIARAKAEIFTGIEPGGTAVLNGDNRHFEFLLALARAEGVQVATFGEVANADTRLVNVDLAPDHSVVEAEVFGTRMSYQLGAPGRHLVQNSLAVATCLHLAGADVAGGLSALGHLSAPKGRGARLNLARDGGHFLVLDESYNANPASMRAAISLLGTAPLGEGGKRIAVLGDMLELGTASEALHAGLAEALIEARIDRVFASGPHMKSLFDALPDKMRGIYATSASGLQEALLETVAKGDAVMVKGSLGSRMGPLVDLLATRYPA